MNSRLTKKITIRGEASATVLNRILGRGHRGESRRTANCRGISQGSTIKCITSGTRSPSLQLGIFLAGEHSISSRTVVDRKSAYRYHQATFPYSTETPSLVRSLSPLWKEKSLCVILQTDTSRVKMLKHDKIRLNIYWWFNNWLN